MTLAVRFDAEAEEELDSAALYYEERRPGLARSFLRAVDDAAGRLRESPGRYTAPPGVPSDLGVRRVLVHQFPFSLAMSSCPPRFAYWPLPTVASVRDIGGTAYRRAYRRASSATTWEGSAIRRTAQNLRGIRGDSPDVARRYGLRRSQKDLVNRTTSERTSARSP